MRLFVCFALAAASACALAAAAVAGGDAVDYPQGYRQWTHVKSGLVLPGHPAYAGLGGFHHLYANEAALDGLRGGRYDDGSVLVFDRLAEVPGVHAYREGARRVIDVMVKDRARYPDTGGWGYEEFVGDSRSERRVVADARARAACSACHVKQAKHDSVFNRWRD